MLVRVLLLGAFPVFLSFHQGNAEPETKRSFNVVLILLDDVGWNGLSTEMDKNDPRSKSDYYETPNLDWIAKQGVRFSSGYASSPVCAPTRYAVQFGRSPQSLGKVDVRHSRLNAGRHSDLLSLPKAMKQIDPSYVTAHFGKWHIDAMPAELGYDESDGMTSNKEGLQTAREHEDRYVMEDGKLSMSLSLRASDFMRRQVREQNPFFLQVSYYANHANPVASPASFQKFSKKAPGMVHNDPFFAGMTADLDDGVGILLKELKELGILNSTYVIVLSDNGAIPSFPPKADLERSFNAPLRMGKWSLFEGGLRVPFLMMGPEIAPDTQIDVPVVAHDLFPSIMDLLDAPQSVFESLEGESFVDVLRKEKVALDREDLVFVWPVHSSWDLIEASVAIRSGPYKLIRLLERDEVLLFHIEDDLGEEHNIAPEFPEVVDTLLEKIEHNLMRNQYRLEILGR